MKIPVSYTHLTYWVGLLALAEKFITLAITTANITTALEIKLDVYKRQLLQYPLASLSGKENRNNMLIRYFKAVTNHNKLCLSA